MTQFISIVSVQWSCCEILDSSKLRLSLCSQDKGVRHNQSQASTIGQWNCVASSQYIASEVLTNNKLV